jgi:hypothetical protein
MTHYLIDVTNLVTTTPGQTDPHVVETWRVIVATKPGGPCRRPVTLHMGQTTRTLPCGRVRLREQQCVGCRSTITVRHVDTVDLGPEARTSARAASGLLKDPCPTCGEPVAAVLADTGRHILCKPRIGQR